MPVHLPECSRRRFLQTNLAAGASLLAGRRLAAREQELDSDSWALLADIHIAENRDEIARGMKMAANLERVGAELLALPELPAGVLVNGDCAYLEGKSGDYRTLVDLLRPVRSGGMPVHLALGNHDHRERFWATAVASKDDSAPSVSRHVSVIETAKANWFLLDSLQATNVTPGELGQQQRDWLAGALDARTDKPAVIVAHHNLDPGNPKTTGLTDSDALLNLLLPRRQVKAYLYGHTHRWQQTERDGLHLINLPPVAYPFRKEDPVGWVHCRLGVEGAVLELRSLDEKHAAHGQIVELTWRSA
jgi:3',5'-cyclic-AMP phosphodiesterase